MASLDTALRAGPARFPVVAVVGACGGSGASTFCAALAVSGAASPSRRRRPQAHQRDDSQISRVLIDLDDAGGGIDILLGLDAHEGARWSDLRLGGGVLDAAQLRDRLPRAAGVGVLACDGAAAPSERDLEQVVSAVSAIAAVVLDVPRWLPPAALCAVRMADAVVLVVPGEVRAAVAADTVLRRLADAGARSILALRPGVLDAGEVAAALAGADAVAIPVDDWMGGDRTGRLDLAAVPERVATAARQVWDLTAAAAHEAGLVR